MRISDWSSDVCSSDLFSVVTAKVDQVGIQRLELGDDSRVIVVAYVDALEKGNISTAFGEVVAHLRRHTRAVGLLIVQNGDGFGLDCIDDVVGSKGALLIGAANRAKEKVRLDGIGNQRGSRTRGDGDNRTEERRVGKECVSTGRFRGET